MDGIAEAKRLLNYYIRKAWEAGGLHWDSDNEAEVEGIVDDLVTGIKKEILSEIINVKEKPILSSVKNGQYTDILVKYKNDNSLYEYRTNLLDLHVIDTNVDYIKLKETDEIIYTQDKEILRDINNDALKTVGGTNMTVFNDKV